MSRYRFSENARADLLSIADRITASPHHRITASPGTRGLGDSGPGRAETFARGVFAALERVAAMPEIGHRREDLTRSDLRFWPVFSYLLVYRPGSSPLEVVRIIHGHRDIETILSDD